MENDFIEGNSWAWTLFLLWLRSVGDPTPESKNKDHFVTRNDYIARIAHISKYKHQPY